MTNSLLLSPNSAMCHEKPKHLSTGLTSSIFLYITIEFYSGNLCDERNESRPRQIYSIDYIMELHREIERLMQNNLEYQDKFEEMKKKKEELEKAKSLREAKTNYLT